MSTAAAEAGDRAVAAFARDAGRSASVSVQSTAGSWHGAAADDVARPAASLLKLGIAIAAERALGHGAPLPASVPAGDILGGDPSPSALRAIDPGIELGVRDVLGLMITLSDNPCATWLCGAVGNQAVRHALAAHGITGIHARDPSAREGPLAGRCTTAQALALAVAAADPAQHPVTAAAMENVVHAARIPIGVQRADLRVAHKTGSLPGVANDVAVIDCGTTRVHVAFLSEDQPDPLVTGYEMGLCTRRILDAWGLGARASRSLSAPVAAGAPPAVNRG